MMATSWEDAYGFGWQGGWRSSLTLPCTYALGHPDVFRLTTQQVEVSSIWGWPCGLRMECGPSLGHSWSKWLPH